jgi:hypothetical protein
MASSKVAADDDETNLDCTPLYNLLVILGKPRDRAVFESAAGLSHKGTAPALKSDKRGAVAQ